MDFQMADDDLDGSAAMNNGHQNAARCPARSSTDGAGGSALSQYGWTHGAQFGGQQVPYGDMNVNAYYPQPNMAGHWTPSGPGLQNSEGLRPYLSHQTRSSAAANNSDYGAHERNHGQAQIHNQSTSHNTDSSRPQLPRVFSNPMPMVSNTSRQSGQQHTASPASSPTHNPGQSIWPTMPQQFTHDGASGFQAPPQPFQRQAYQFGDSLPPAHAFRYLPHPSLNSYPHTAGNTYGAYRQNSQNNPHDRLHAQHPTFANMLAGNPYYPHVHSQGENYEPRSPAPAIPYGDSDDDSEVDDDEDDDDTDPSPPRLHERAVENRAMSQADAQAILEVGRAAQARERQRAARRAQLLANAKTIAHPDYITNLKRVDIETLEGDELLCMICYNEFGVKNPDGHVEAAVRLDKCKHIMGEICLKKWFEDSDSCPYCRDKVPGMQKSRARHYRPGEGDSAGRRGIEALYRSYELLEPEERAAMETFGARHDRHPTSYGHAVLDRIRAAEERRQQTPAERERLLRNMRDEQDRPPIAEYRDRYERILLQRQASESSENSNAGPTYATRTVPQSERRRQARIRAASNRGANTMVDDIRTHASRMRGNLFGHSVDGAETSRQGAARSTHHSAQSSLDSTSSAIIGPRSATPHPTILDGTANASLNPAAAPWNGMTQHPQRQSLQSQPQPNGPPDSPRRALFGYYRTEGQRASMPVTPTHQTGHNHNQNNQNQNGQNHNYNFTVVNGNPDNGSPVQRQRDMDGAPAWQQAAAQSAGAAAGSVLLANAMDDAMDNELYNFEPPAVEDDGWGTPAGDVEMPDLGEGDAGF